MSETSPIQSTSGKTSSMPIEMSTLSPDPQVTDLSPSWVGFKIVGDNIDKTVRPRHQTLSSCTQSLHYFHAFAVQDRIDASNMSDSKPNLDLSSLPYTQLLSYADDLKEIKSNCVVLLSRVLVKYKINIIIYSRTSLSGHSEKRTHSLERTKF